MKKYEGHKYGIIFYLYMTKLVKVWSPNFKFIQHLAIGLQNKSLECDQLINLGGYSPKVNTHHVLKGSSQQLLRRRQKYIFSSQWPKFDHSRPLKVKYNGSKTSHLGTFLYMFNSNYAPRKHYYPNISLSILLMNANESHQCSKSGNSTNKRCICINWTNFT